MKESKKILCWAYCRFSSQNQRQESIQAQKRAILDWANKNNAEILRWYIDEACSARTDNREQFLKMIEDSKKKENKDVSCIVVHKSDRFARNKYDSAIYKRELALNSKKLHSVTEHFEDTPESRLLESVVEGMNQFYSENLAREALKGLKENAYTKRSTGSTPPLGLKVNKETLMFEIDEPNADAIRLLFKRFVEDRWSYKMICDELNAKGFRTTRGNLFNSKSTLIDYLNNEKYVGRLTYLKSKKDPVTGKRTCKRDYNRDEIIAIDNAIPAIIDDVTFNKAQEILAQRRRNASSYKNSRKKNLFVGKLFCGKCGCLMNINTRKSGKSKEYYSTFRCTSKNEKMANKCDNREISVNHLERYVISQLMFYLKQDETLDRIVNLLNDSLNASEKRKEQEKISIDQKIKNVDIKIQNLMNALAVANGSIQSLLETVQKLEKEKQMLIDRVNKMESTNTVLPKVNKEEIKKLLEKAKEYMLSENDEQIRAVIDLFIEKIVVGENDVEIIYYLHPFSFVRGSIWETYVSRKELMDYKGFLPKVMKGRWSKKALINLSESKPTLAKVISLVV